MISEYINSIKNNRKKLTELRQSISRYKLLCNQFGQNFVDEAIFEIKKEKAKETLNDLEVFVAYENEIKNIVMNKYSHYTISPAKEIDSKDIIGIAKRYNTTTDVAQIIVDLKISEPHIAAILAKIILKYDLKNNPNAIELSHIIYNNKLDNNPNAVLIANMIKYGISQDLANEVIQYNNNEYSFKRADEKYIFHKLKQIYQVKIKTESVFSFQQEIERIMNIINIDYEKAKYLLVSCMGNNWGRNSSFYWNYESFKDDFANDGQEYTKEDISAIKSYVQNPSINRFARGFKISDGSTIYSNGKTAEAMKDEQMLAYSNYYAIPLYKALNKNSLSKDVIVFRGSSLSSLGKYKVNIDDSEEIIKKKLGTHYQDGGFMSTSAVVEKGGSGDFLGGNVNFIINLKAGTPCGELSKYAKENECEVLIPPNVDFMVDDVRKMDGKIFVYLTSIPNKSLSYVSNNEDEKSEGRHL